MVRKKVNHIWLVLVFSIFFGMLSQELYNVYNQPVTVSAASKNK